MGEFKNRMCESQSIIFTLYLGAYTLLYCCSLHTLVYWKLWSGLGAYRCHRAFGRVRCLLQNYFQLGRTPDNGLQSGATLSH